MIPGWFWVMAFALELALQHMKTYLFSKGDHVGVLVRKESVTGLT